MSQILSKITEEEIEFCELFYYPVCLAECLFSNMDNLAEFDENKIGEVRKYQSPMLSWDFFVDVENDDRLVGRQSKFNARKAVSDIYCFGGRKFGKSLALIILDLLLYIIYAIGEKCVIASVDMNHISNVLSPVKSSFEAHPFVKIFYKKAFATTSKYYLETKNGVEINSVNTNPTSADEGKKGWYGHHAKRIYVEEASLLSTESVKAARDATSEFGAIIRWSGMTNFNSYSPAGEVYNDKSYYPKVVNLPQYVNPTFTEETEKERIREFGSSEAIEFRQFVGGEIVGDNVQVVNIDKVNFNREKNAIHFEINDDNFIHFRDLIVVNRPEVAELGYLAADVSDVNITDILLIYKWNHQYHYKYRITLRGLDDSKQKKVFKWLVNKAGIDYVAIDFSDALGRAIVNYLETEIGQQFIYGIGFNEKIKTDIEIDDRTKKPKRIKGDFVYKEEWVSIWAVRCLLRLMYDGKLELAYDATIEKQLSKIVAEQNSSRIVYRVKSKDDHAYQALTCFAILEFKLDFEHKTEARKKAEQPKWGLGV